MNTPDTNDAPATASTSSSHASGGVKKWLIGVIVALLSAAALWGWGYSQGRAALSVQRIDYERRLSDADAQQEKTRAELGRTLNRSRQLEARALLLGAAIELERRNFGTANTRLREAAITLQPAFGGVSSTGEDTNLSALQKEISATNLAVATDVGRQRERVLRFAAQLEQLTPAASPSLAPPTTVSSPVATGGAMSGGENR